VKGFNDRKIPATFIGQVVAFLEPEHQSDYRERAAWDTLQEHVVDTLRELER
jgi:hypothetical protein